MTCIDRAAWMAVPAAEWWCDQCLPRPTARSDALGRGIARVYVSAASAWTHHVRTGHTITRVRVRNDFG